MPHHYKKKQTGPISKKKKGGVKPKQQTKMGPGKPKEKPATRTQRKPQPPAKRKKWENPGFNPEGKTLPQGPVRTDKLEDRPGFFMQMGSKEINTPSNFSERSAMLMNGDPGSGQYNMYGDYYKDAMNSLGQDQMMSMEETFDQAYEKAGYNMPELTKAIQSQSTQEGYSALGHGLGKILFPNAADNKRIRKEEKEKGLYSAGSSPKKGGYFSQDRVRKRVQNRVARKSARKARKKFKI